MTGPVYVTEPPLSPPSPRASAQTPMPTPPQPERPALEVAPAPAPATPAEPEAPAGLPLEGLLLRFGLITTEQLTEAMRERSATGKDIGAIVVERGWVDAAQLARVVSGDTAAAPEPAPEPEPAADPEPTPVPPPPAAAQPSGQRVVCLERRQLLDADVASARQPQRLRVERLLEDRPREARVAEPLAARRALEDRPQRTVHALAEAVLGRAREALGYRDQLVR